MGTAFDRHGLPARAMQFYFLCTARAFEEGSMWSGLLHILLMASSNRFPSSSSTFAHISVRKGKCYMLAYIACIHTRVGRVTRIVVAERIL
jgi:hypothetical protein